MIAYFFFIFFSFHMLTLLFPFNHSLFNLANIRVICCIDKSSQTDPIALVVRMSHNLLHTFLRYLGQPFLFILQQLLPLLQKRLLVSLQFVYSLVHLSFYHIYRVLRLCVFFFRLQRHFRYHLNIIARNNIVFHIFSCIIFATSSDLNTVSEPYLKQNIFIFIAMYQSSTRAQTLHQHPIPDATSLPLPQQKRKITDVVCLIIGILFGLILLIIAIALYNRSNLSISEYPSDLNGIVCMLNNNGSHKFPFVYFNNLQNPQTERYCVEDCPEEGVAVSCIGECNINYYPNYASNSALGAFCLPSDENLKNKLISDAGLDQKFNAIKAIDYLLTGLGIAFGFSIIWMLIVQFLPKYAIWMMFFISAALLIVAACIAFIGSSSHFAENQGLAIFFGIIFVFFFLLLVYYLCVHRRQLEICSCFLEIAADCFKENLTSVLYILLFIILTISFVVLLVFEYLAFSSGKPTQNGVYYHNYTNGFLFFLVVIEGIWGFSFFRDAFNYVISGIADQWYFHKLNMFCYPIKRLFTKNLGSVVGGSFLTAFFYIPELIISFLAPGKDCCFCNFFDLARSDAYSYIYLTGNSYCPSSRQTQYLCLRSKICRESESSLAIYAIFTRLSIAFASVLLVYWITKDNLVEEKVPMLLLIGVFIICLYITCYFADIHAVIAQALMICFLTEYELEEGWSYKEMRACPTKLSQLIIDIEEKNTNYGNPRGWQ